MRHTRHTESCDRRGWPWLLKHILSHFFVMCLNVSRTYSRTDCQCCSMCCYPEEKERIKWRKEKKNKKKDLETGIKIQRTLKEEILSPFLVILQ